MTGTHHVHQCLVHASDEHLAAVAGEVLRDGLAAGSAAVVVGSDHLVALVSEAVRDVRLRTLVREAPLASLAAAVAGLERLVRQELAQGARGVRVVGEPDFGPGGQAWRDRLRYEAIIDHALVGSPVWGLCPVDARRVPPREVAACQAAHSHLTGPDGRPTPNPGHQQPREVLRALGPPPRADPLEAQVPVVDLADVRRPAVARDAVRLVAMGTLVPLDAADGLVVAVSEVVTNALRHGRPPVRVRVWAQAHRLLCTVTDRGTGHDGVLTGYRAPRPGLLAGVGIWAARQLVDDVRFRTGEDGFTVALDVGAAAAS